jgi:hypothetical protein
MPITYEVVLAAHVIAFMWNIAWVVVSDFVGLLWLIGKLETVSKKFLHLTHWFIWVGLTISVLTGVYLFLQSADYLLTLPAFYTKSVLVFALIVNSFVIGKHIDLAANKTFATTNKSERIHLAFSAVVSTIGWAGVVVAASMLGL